MVSPTPICPKCAYDQSGQIATWKTKCPTQGTCPECGYTLSWPDIIDPSRIQLPWFVEHAKSKRQLLTRTLPTLWILLFPNRYWKRVTMETPRSIKRYLLWLTLLILILHILTTATLIAVNYGFTHQNNARTNQLISQLTPEQQKQYAFRLTDLTSIDYWRPTIGEAFLLPLVHRSNFEEGVAQGMAMFATLCLGISIIWFLLFCTFQTTRNRSKLRMIHVLRATVVAGFLPFLSIELGRFLDAAYLLSTYWNPISRLSILLYSVVFVCILWMVIWQQWFWIAATRIGWQVKAKWWELILVTTASFLGIPIAVLIMIAFKPIRIAIDHFAVWIGI